MAKKQLTREERLDAYDKVVALARDAALIHLAVGGVVMILHPHTADEENFTARLLQMADAEEV